jgi:hypothetical protein
MITASDSFNTVDLGRYFAIMSASPGFALDSYCDETGAVRVPAGYAYNSGSNPDFLTVDQLRMLIQEHVTGVAQTTRT